LTFVDDICVFCPSVRGLRRILDVCQSDAGLHEIIFNCSKTVCMMFKANSAKSTAIPLLTLGVLKVRSVSCHKYLRIVLDIELSDDKDIPRQIRYQYEAVNKLRASFSRCSNAVKNVLSRTHKDQGICRSLMSEVGVCNPFSTSQQRRVKLFLFVKIVRFSSITQIILKYEINYFTLHGCEQMVHG